MDNMNTDSLTRRDINYISQLAQREGLSLPETCKRLVRVFVGMLLLIAFITLIGAIEIYRKNIENFYAYLIAYIIAIIIFMMIAPVRLGARLIINRKKMKF